MRLGVRPRLRLRLRLLILLTRHFPPSNTIPSNVIIFQLTLFLINTRTSLFLRQFNLISIGIIILSIIGNSLKLTHLIYGVERLWFLAIFSEDSLFFVTVITELGLALVFQ